MQAFLAIGSVGQPVFPSDVQAPQNGAALAQRLWKAGCFAIVLECVPASVAAAITKAVDIPTIGIGGGPHCSGQV